MVKTRSSSSAECCICLEKFTNLHPICGNSILHQACNRCATIYFTKHYIDPEKFKEGPSCPLCRSTVGPSLEAVFGKKHFTVRNLSAVCIRNLRIGIVRGMVSFDKLLNHFSFLDSQYEGRSRLRETDERQTWFSNYNEVADTIATYMGRDDF